MSSSTLSKSSSDHSIQIKREKNEDDDDVVDDEENDETKMLLRKRFIRTTTPSIVLTKDQEDIPTIILFGYMFGHVLNDMTASLWFTYVLVFMEKQAEMSETNAAIVFLCGQFVDAIFNPISGIVIDALPFESSRVYYVLFGSCGVALTFSLIFVVPNFIEDASTTIKVLWYCSWASLFNIFWSFVQVSHFSLVDEITTTTKSKLRLNKFGQVGSACAAILSFSTARLVFQLDMSSKRQFTVLSFCVIAIGLVCVFVFASLVLGNKNKCLMCRLNDDEDGEAAEYNEFQAKKKKLQNDSKQSKSWYEFFCILEFYEAISLYTKARMVMIVVMTFLAPYLVACSNHDEGIKTAANAMILYHTFYCIIVLFEFFFCMESFRIHSRVLLLMSYGALCIASATLTTSIWAMDPMFHDGGDGIHAIYIPISLCGIAAYYLVATSRTLVNELSCKYNSTFVIGAAGFAEKAIIGILVFLIQDAERKYDDGYWWSISLVPTFVASAGLILATLCMTCSEKIPTRTTMGSTTTTKKAM